MGKHPEIRLKQRAFTTLWTFQLKTTSQNSIEVSERFFNYRTPISFPYHFKWVLVDSRRIFGCVLLSAMLAIALIGVVIPKDLEGSEEYFKIVPER